MPRKTSPSTKDIEELVLQAAFEVIREAEVIKSYQDIIQIRLEEKLKDYMPPDQARSTADRAARKFIQNTFDF